MKMKKNILLCAGGTGGHLFAAQAVFEKLNKDKWQIYLATDRRAFKFTKGFLAKNIFIISSATFNKNIFLLLFALAKLFFGYFHSHYILWRYKIDVVVGFGGYPTIPPLLAASHRGIKTIIHEQNAKFGKANLFLKSRATTVACGFNLANGGKKANKKNSKKIIHVGNPLRAAVYKAAKIAYPKRKKNEKFNFLIFGGSQGAEFFCDILPLALANMPDRYIARLNITLQIPRQLSNRKNNLLAKINCSPFFENMPKLIAESHFIMCRAGASTIGELVCIGRPSLLVPLENIGGGEQIINAKYLVRAKAAIMLRQKTITAKTLAKAIMQAMDGPQKLLAQAKNAKGLNVDNAAVKLVNEIEKLTEQKHANKK